MHLVDKLKSVETIEGFCTLINKAEASIDWNGRRLVKVSEFEGSVEINLIAQKFLNFPHFTDIDADTSLCDRIALFFTWEKIEKLFYSSGKNTLLYHYALSAYENIKDYTTNYYPPIRIILGASPWGKEEFIFQFTPREYQRLWPVTPPKKIIFLMENEPNSQRFIATKQMIQILLLNDTLD